MQQEYFIGLDMGTNSVGWAVTDKNYNLLRAKGKDMWGIREFEEAKPALDRRTKRVARRRRQREQVRIGHLKSYFAEGIEKIDPNFFGRLENSKYIKDDKEFGNNSLFDDEDFKDKDYFNKYKTIFHLRSELIHDKTPHDVRLVYLALLNMYKHRGHFLNNSVSDMDNSEKISLKETYAVLQEKVTDEIFINLEDFSNEIEFENIISSKEYSRTIKLEKITSLLELDKKSTDFKVKQLILKLICGLKIDARALFEDLKENEEKIEICFNDFGYDDKVEEIINAIGESHYAVIEAAKNLYDQSVLQQVLGQNDYLSDARVSMYDKHKTDLDILKKVVKKYCDEKEYDVMFRSGDKSSYAAYVNSNITDNKKQRRSYKERSQDALYKKIRSLLKQLPIEDDDVKYIQDEIERENFLPKQLSASNGVIPNQVHTKEMRAILKNAEEYLPFLKDKNEVGLTVSEQIIELFKFQVPYYIGPTTENSQKNKGNGWVVRKEAGEVLPWNIKQKIDIDATHEKFISRLVRNCTYIAGEKAMPKASLLYQKYSVLNEINNIKINNQRISVQLKQEIYTELFEEGKKVTKNKLVKFLSNRGYIEKAEDISGIDLDSSSGSINNALTTYGKFKAILKDEIKKESVQKKIDDIVYWATVYGDSKNLLKKRLEEDFSDLLDEKAIKRVLGFKFADWGKFSKEFIELPGCYKTTGEIMSLIGAMWQSNLNMMELINSDEYSFAETLEEKKKNLDKTLWEFKAEDLDDYYFNAPVKRMIWQTVLVVREIVDILGSEPERIFVEVTRSGAEKQGKRTNSRKTQLLELYKNVKDESRDWIQIIENEDKTGRLRSKKMYLYLRQMGRCMYTGEPIELSELFDDNKYDIDHIYPRHFVKDDNIENNLVLVDKRKNANKSDKYPIDASIRNNPKVRELWEALRTSGLIQSEKYRRLTGNKELTEENKADFIARQMVETNQAVKAVTSFLTQIFRDRNTEVVYSKASNVSDFRHDYARKELEDGRIINPYGWEFPKSRLVNDFHHANDAYLNIVVGNTFHVKFTKNPLNFIRNEVEKKNEKYNLNKVFNFDVKRGKDVAWIAKKDDNEATIDTVKKVMAKNTPILTRLSFEGKGGIANETLYAAKDVKDKGYLPLKESDEKLKNIKNYGGFTSVSTSYFFLVEHEIKGKKVRTLETVPVYMRERIENDPSELEKYCFEKLGLINPSIRMRKIKLQSLFRINDYYGHITGVTGKQLYVRNAVQMSLKPEYVKYISKLEKIVETNTSNIATCELNIKLYDELSQKHLTSIFAKKPNPVGNKLTDKRDIFASLSVEKQVKILIEILKLSWIGRLCANLEEINEGSSVGLVLISKNISSLEKAYIVTQSVTGLYEKRIDLLNV